MFGKKEYVYVNERDSSKKLDDEVEKMRRFWWPFSMFVIAMGVISLFTAGIIFDKKISISIMNSWVGIVLGLVATVIGIISMFLSFYNLDQSIKTQDKTLASINNIKNGIINYVDKTSKETQDVIRKSQETQVSLAKSNVIKPSFESMGGKAEND